VVIPSTLLLTAADLAERVACARVGNLIVPAAETGSSPAWTLK
jgi:hypothetical protein